MIDVKKITGGYSSKPILESISFEVDKGELFGVIGPNGSGKSTLLKMISHILPFQKGEITIKGKSIRTYNAKEFARLVAVLPQTTTQTFSYTVRETVSLGRYAHQKGLFQSLTESDEAIIQDVMKQTGVDIYENETIDELSGDRKSTRLNSSHVAISYAVFCLKKKKQKRKEALHREHKKRHAKYNRS